VKIDEVDWSGAGRGENAEVVSQREDRVEGSKGIMAWIVPAGDVGLRVES
jgi:hypothetical protein